MHSLRGPSERLRSHYLTLFCTNVPIEGNGDNISTTDVDVKMTAVPKDGEFFLHKFTEYEGKQLTRARICTKLAHSI